MKRESTKPQANSKNKGTKKAHQEQAAYFEQLIQYRENEVDQKKKKKNRWQCKLRKCKTKQAVFHPQLRGNWIKVGQPCNKGQVSPRTGENETHPNSIYDLLHVWHAITYAS